MEGGEGLERGADGAALPRVYRGRECCCSITHDTNSATAHNATIPPPSTIHHPAYINHVHHHPHRPHQPYMMITCSISGMWRCDDTPYALMPSAISV